MPDAKKKLIDFIEDSVLVDRTKKRSFYALMERQDLSVALLKTYFKKQGYSVTKKECEKLLESKEKLIKDLNIGPLAY